MTQWTVTLYTPTWQVLGDKKYYFRPSPLDFKAHTTNPDTKCTLQHREHSLNPQLRGLFIPNTTFGGAVELSTPPQHQLPALAIPAARRANFVTRFNRDQSLFA